MIYEKFNVEIIDNDTPYGNRYEGKILEVIGAVGDKLLIADEYGNLIEMYSRKCRKVN